MKRNLADAESSELHKKKSRRLPCVPGFDSEHFLLEVLDSGYTTFNVIDHKRRRRGTIDKYIVGQSGAEFQVRLTIYEKAWELHRWDYFHATLYIDGQRIRSRFLEKPLNRGEEVSYIWDNNQEGYAFKFAQRNTGKVDFSSEQDNKCGIITVELKAAAKLDYRHRERLRKHSRPPPIRNRFESARNVQMNDATKEKHTVLRTVEGSRIYRPGGGGPPPAKIVTDYVYASLTLFYDEAAHLEWRGILKPTYCKEHRIYFPARDFEKIKELRRQRSKKAPVIGDLTDDSKEKAQWGRMLRKTDESKEEDERSVIYSDSDWKSVGSTIISEEVDNATS